MAEQEDQDKKFIALVSRAKDYRNMSESSRQLLKEDPIGYATTRKRQLTSALLEGDDEQAETLVADVACVVGALNAEWWKLTIMEQLVDKSLNEQNRKRH